MNRLKLTHLLAWTLTLTSAGCAGTRSGGREFERPEFKQVRMKSLDVVVTVAGPVLASPPVFSVPSFDAPTWSTVLRAPEEEMGTREALVASLGRQLAAQGYETQIRHAGARAESAALTTQPAIETSTAAMSAVGTSSISIGASMPSPPERPAPLFGESYLAEGTSLRDVLDSSEADAVMVVRAVVVDAFYFFDRSDERLIQQPGSGGISGGQQVVDGQAIQRSGRLLLGQVFVFDRRTGLRLWSRQRPDFPENGRLNANSSLLKYGYVRGDGEAELMPEAKAAKAASSFTKAMLAPFAPPNEGTAAGRSALAQLDPEQEQARQSFLDEGHLVLQLDAGWSLESAGVDVVLDGEVVDRLGAGALAPTGVFRLTPRVGYQSPGGFVFSLGVPLGFAPNDFSRTYFIDNPDRNVGDPDHRGVGISLGSPSLGGLELGGGKSFVITPKLLVHGSGGAFAEIWTFDGAPSTIVSDQRLYRFGVYGGGSLMYRVSQDGPLFLHSGARVRLGWASAGPAIYGLDLQMGLGLFL